MPTTQIRPRPFSTRTASRRTIIAKSVARRERRRQSRIALADVVPLFVPSQSALARSPRGVGSDRTERSHLNLLVDPLQSPCKDAESSPAHRPIVTLN